MSIIETSRISPTKTDNNRWNFGEKVFVERENGDDQEVEPLYFGECLIILPYFINVGIHILIDLALYYSLQ